MKFYSYERTLESLLSQTIFQRGIYLEALGKPEDILNAESFVILESLCHLNAVEMKLYITLE
jgi:hypothetical protein